MLNEETLRRALAAAGLSAPVRWDDVTGSTNATALALAAEGTPGWTLVATGHQTDGRGRHGRRWLDRPGSSLLFSVVIRPAWDPRHVGLVSLAAGAAMAEAASEISGLRVRCKWPNDLMLGDAKAGGILAESEIAEARVRHVVVGVGVNLRLPDDVAGAAAIGMIDEGALLSTFLGRFRRSIEDAPSEISRRWRAVSSTIGRSVEATTLEGDVVRGVAADLDEAGALLLDAPTGRVRVAFGAIEHLQA